MGILSKDSLFTRKYVSDSKDLFIDVAESKPESYSQEYSILNYPMIVRQMCDYFEGYVECKSTGEQKYTYDVLPKTVGFYDNMFKSEKYRKKIHLSDMDDLMKDFLTETKRLQTLLETELNKSLNSVDTEMKAMIELTNNQYKKLTKVNRDDMMIFLWLIYKNELGGKSYEITGALRAAYINDMTPVMHEVKKR